MADTPNPQIELAFDYIQNTDKNIFLTGKAGTGKTTFLHRVKAESIKRMVVVAPTGVAAINAQGMTIHSFFQLPFGPYLPDGGTDLTQQRKFSKKKIDLIRSLDLLIIDEISMVRSDLLDGIDDVLRRYQDGSKPFGGVQLLMIGDLHQLPPVVKNEEWSLLREHYDTPYFFGSLALQKTDAITIELKHIYRQSDTFFIDLLNKVRNNKMDADVLDAINSRYIPSFSPAEEDGYITLTSHNASAQRINTSKLQSILRPLHTFTANIDGNFPAHTYPTEEKLEFKEGAQVVFIKNDTSFEKRYYNGKIGQIDSISSEGVIWVKCPDDTELISVTPAEWNNVQYNLNETTKEVTEEVIGTFTQYPLKLAWAITIHKSQGLTFERAIIDAQSAFAHGQVYVALSRCKSFEGIVLLSRIGQSSVKTDMVVRNYSEEASKNEPSAADLQRAKQVYQQGLIRDLFDFKTIEKNMRAVNRVFLEFEKNFVKSPMTDFILFAEQANSEVFTIASKFLIRLEQYFRAAEMPAEHDELKERLKKASVYFVEKLKNGLLKSLKKIPAITDNAATKKRTTEALEALEKALFIKNACFEVAGKGFSVKAYLQTQTNADIDFAKYQRQNQVNSTLGNVPSGTPNPLLYAQLLHWRDEEAMEKGVTLYEILPTRSLLELVEVLPTDKATLLKIKGIGSYKIKQYGAALVELIDAYCTNHNITPNVEVLSFSSYKTPPKKMPKAKKPDTKVVSFDLFKIGKTVETIALERNLTPNTIFGHLGHFVALGQLDIFKLMEKFKVEEVEAYIISTKTTSRSDIRTHFGEKYSYAEIKMVLDYLKYKGGGVI